MGKTYSQTYLFSKYSEYEKYMYEFIIKGERINASSKEFEDILYDIKRRKISDCLTKIITSNNVVMCINPAGPLPKAFKAFTAADVNDGRNVKAFIDVTDCITLKNGVYVCSKLDWLISYVINAMTSFIYNKAENKLTGNSSILKDGCTAWVSCFDYIIDRMYKISSVPNIKYRVSYLAAIYFQVNIMGKDLDVSRDSIKANAIRVANIEPSQASVVDVMLQDGDFTNIATFCNAVARVCNLQQMKVDNVVSLWMQSFGTGTLFALEYLPAFSAMMTNTYVGAYLDQQMTIEKVTGQAMVNYAKTILQIGESVQR